MQTMQNELEYYNCAFIFESFFFLYNLMMVYRQLYLVWNTWIKYRSICRGSHCLQMASLNQITFQCCDFFQTISLIYLKFICIPLFNAKNIFFQCLYLYVLIVYDIWKSGQQFSLAPSWNFLTKCNKKKFNINFLIHCYATVFVIWKKKHLYTWKHLFESSFPFKLNMCLCCVTKPVLQFLQ